MWICWTFSVWIYLDKILYCVWTIVLIFKKIKMLYCAVCNKPFLCKTSEDLREFSNHVGKCPMRNDSFLIERFTCKSCKHVMRDKRSFTNHLLKCQHITNGIDDQCLSRSVHFGKQISSERRNISETWKVK